MLEHERPSVPTSDFFRKELSRALAENGYALMAWEVQPSANGVGLKVASDAQSIAKVTLMPEREQRQAGTESGVQITVCLNMKGYTIMTGDATATSPSQTYYEVLDDLLATASTAYRDRRQQLLFSKLEDVARERRWADCDDNAND